MKVAGFKGRPPSATTETKEVSKACSRIIFVMAKERTYGQITKANTRECIRMVYGTRVKMDLTQLWFGDSVKVNTCMKVNLKKVNAH